MATFSPFMQSTEAQNIISNYLGGGYNTTKTTPFRNPHFDIRTQQEAAGTLDPSALYPNPQIDFSVQEEVVDPCLPGYQLIDGVCQPMEQFGQSMYDEKRDREDRDEEERDYYSIEEMKNLGDYELLKYLDDGWLKGDKFNSTIGGSFVPLQFQIPFGKQNQMRRNFIIDELTRRGYNIGANDKGNQQFNVGNAFGLISNAEAANKGGNRLATNQLSIFTPDEINYQIQAKNEADKVIQQGGNPYAQTMTEQEVIQDAQQSGGTVNPFEATMAASKEPPKKTKSTPSSYYMGGHHY